MEVTQKERGKFRKKRDSEGATVNLEVDKVEILCRKPASPGSQDIDDFVGRAKVSWT
jgi:hypothetical protein